MTQEYSSIGVLDICKKAGLAKGSFYLYFQSKEEAFLKLALHHVSEWGGALDLHLSKLSVQPKYVDAATSFVESLKSFHPMLKLFSLLHSIIEKNVVPEKILPFKLEMIQLQQRQIKQWQRLYPKMSESAALELIIFLSAALVGVWTIANPPPPAMLALKSAGLEDSILPFEPTLRRQIEIFLKGLLP